MRVKKVLVITVIAVAVFISAPASRSFVSSPGDQMTDTGQLHAVVENTCRMEAGRKMKFMIVDARTPDEYNEAHVIGAVSIPEEDFEKSLGLLPSERNALIVVYCNDRKCVSNRRWAAKAFAAGYPNVIAYSDGFPHWKCSACPWRPSDNGTMRRSPGACRKPASNFKVVLNLLTRTDERLYAPAPCHWSLFSFLTRTDE